MRPCVLILAGALLASDAWAQCPAADAFAMELEIAKAKTVASVAAVKTDPYAYDFFGCTAAHCPPSSQVKPDNCLCQNCECKPVCKCVAPVDYAAIYARVLKGEVVVTKGIPGDPETQYLCWLSNGQPKCVPLSSGPSAMPVFSGCSGGNCSVR